jgi:pyruvate dehydrogenase E1 component alpha subunit
LVFRSRAVFEEWRQRDPIVIFRRRLLAEAGLTEAAVQGIEAEVQAALDEAVQFAAASPAPAPESALAGVYHDTHDGRVF